MNTTTTTPLTLASPHAHALADAIRNQITTLITTTRDDVTRTKRERHARLRALAAATIHTTGPREVTVAIPTTATTGLRPTQVDAIRTDILETAQLDTPGIPTDYDPARAHITTATTTSTLRY